MLSSRALPPLVFGVFLLIYIGIAFVTNDALIALMDFTRTNIFLTVLLALLPLSCAGRIVVETSRYIKRRRALAGNAADVPAGLFDETVELSASSSLAGLKGRLDAVGYKTRDTGSALVAWQGTSCFPARILLLAGTCCLFTGIFISLNTRVSYRETVIEGEPFPSPSGDGGIVRRIILGKSSGFFLSKSLTMEVAVPGSGEVKEKMGLYPPSQYLGAFVYPRYLGVGLFIRFSAPDLPAGYETHSILSIYPPGKEASEEIPGTPYRIILTLAEPDDGSDPYMTGHMIFLFSLLKGKEVVLTGRAPSGGEFSQGGYRISFPDSRRLVITDFIQDPGVLLIWTAAILFIAAGSIWMPVRFFFPRREMLFHFEKDEITAFSRAEGRRRKHAGVFHEALDALEAARPPIA
jgi:hypothetical protein